MKKKRKILIKPIILLLMALLIMFSSFFSIYALSLLSGIETYLRITVSAIIIVFLIFFIYEIIKSLKKGKRIFIISPIIIIYSIILILVGHYIIKTYKVVDNFTTDATLYSSSLVTLSSNKTNKLKSVKGTVGILDDEDNVIGSIIPNDLIKKQKLDVELKKYSSYLDILIALYEEEIDYAFLPTNYMIMFTTYEGKDFSKIDEETKIIHTEEKKVKTKQNNSSTTLDKPFAILLMGVDSENEEIAGSSFNGDSLLLITFNPTTLNATLLSIPRDTYVPITCFAGKKKNKITHAAWYGEECMISTIENFTGIHIDYYVKINFKGLVKIVDTLGGVDVNVPYSFCEQDSNRKFGNNTVYVREGFQTLNGEQALAFSRNRHPWPLYCPAEFSNYESNDFVRGQNQQSVLKSILNKIKEKGSIDTIYNLLDVVSKSMETNMQTTEIFSLYNIFKDVIAKSSGTNIDDVIGMQRLYLSGKDAMIYEESMGLNLYNFVYYNESLDQVARAMRINLELEEPQMIKTFKFDIDEAYEESIIGQISSGTTDSYGPAKKIEKEETKDEEVVEVPNFVGMTYKQAKAKASELGLYLNAFPENETDKVLTQDTPAKKEVKKGVTIKLTFEESKKEESKEEKKEEVKEEPKKEDETSTKKEETQETNNESIEKENQTINDTTNVEDKKDIE